MNVGRHSCSCSRLPSSTRSRSRMRTLTSQISSSDMTGYAGGRRGIGSGRTLKLALVAAARQSGRFAQQALRRHSVEEIADKVEVDTELARDIHARALAIQHGVHALKIGGALLVHGRVHVKPVTG